MSREDLFIVRHATIPAVGESNAERAVINRLGFQVVTDFITQLVLSGHAHHMQIGTEDAPANTTAAIDDELVFALIDNPVGKVLIPLLYEVNVGTFTTSTLIQAMLEIDKAKNRYLSGGTAFAPANLNAISAVAKAFSGSAYVGTDVTAVAKSAVPLSVELARHAIGEDNVATATGVENLRPIVYSVAERPIAVISGLGSMLLHFGAATADATGYAVAQFAQLDSGQLS